MEHRPEHPTEARRQEREHLRKLSRTCCHVGSSLWGRRPRGRGCIVGRTYRRSHSSFVDTRTLLGRLKSVKNLETLTALLIFDSKPEHILPMLIIHDLKLSYSQRIISIAHTIRKDLVSLTQLMELL